MDSAYEFVRCSKNSVTNQAVIYCAVLTCICLRRRIFRTTLSFWRTAPTDCDVMTRFVVSRYVKLESRYVITCVFAGSRRGGGSENKSYKLRRMLLQYRVKCAVLQVWPIEASGGGGGGGGVGGVGGRGGVGGINKLVSWKNVIRSNPPCLPPLVPISLQCMFPHSS
jgi:hypothetical protein